MTRTGDQTPPAVSIDPDHAQRPWQLWRLVVALERLPLDAYVWDDDDDAVVWDAAGDVYVWDSPQIGSGYTDVFCDYTGLAIVHGEPDEHELYATSSCTLTLLDPDGRYRNRTADGRLTYYAPGKGLAVWVVDTTGAKWWLFNGRIANWHDPMDSSRQITITAYSGTAELAQDPGSAWTPGAASDFASTRITAILAAAGYTRPYRRDAGDLQLALPAADSTPALELCQQAAWSDGGIVYSDADDTLWFRDRRWRNGRGDQTRVWTITDNACSEAVSDDAVEVWDFAAADDDDWLAGLVVLQNLAKLTATAQAAAGTEGALSTALRYTHAGDDLWQTQGAGNALASHILAQRSTARLAVGNATILLHDQRHDRWQMLDTRIGDLIRLQRGDTNPDGTLSLIDLALIVQTLRHDITPETWAMSLETSPAVSYATFELWDETSFTWDDTDAKNVWR